MKLFTAAQIREWDQYTIVNEPIKSIDLMERASKAFVDWLVGNFHPNQKIYIFSGAGNNGGDGLAIGRLLKELNYEVHIYFCNPNNNISMDCGTNLRLINVDTEIHEESDINSILETEDRDVIIDGLFGSGLTRPLTGFFANLVNKMNELKGVKVAIDIPSGMFCDSLNFEGTIFEADEVISFQIPKRSFLFPESYNYAKAIQCVDIGLTEAYANETKCNWQFIKDSDIELKPYNKFAHKGTFGHALLIAGSKGKMGACILSAKAALRSGCGLLTCRVPSSGNDIIQTALPEAMVSVDINANLNTSIPELDGYNAIGIGPGLGTDDKTAEMLLHLLQTSTVPLVLDADALNIIAERQWLEHIPSGSILTPHPKEFERLFGKTESSMDAIRVQLENAVKHQLVIIRKGMHTSIALPSGTVYFNSTGNPGMGTAGSGDVLTGVITSLVAQGYSSEKAAIIGVYHHGLAGDVAANHGGERRIIASDIINHLFTE